MPRHAQVGLIVGHADVSILDPGEVDGVHYWVAGTGDAIVIAIDAELNAHGLRELPVVRVLDHHVVGNAKTAKG